MKIYWLLFCCAFAFADQSQHHEDPQVQSQAGTFRGSILKSYSGKNIYSFRGIPYAEAPIYQNRFKAPIPVKPFTGVFNATKDGPSCPQPNIGIQIMSEDCLHLNVHTSDLSQNSSGSHSKLPVIFYIHPGGFFSFSGSSYDLGPQHLLEQDIVLVTFNYRLGALGFLSTGDSWAPGNAGLKDQVLALKWVQQNIEAFGGDPDKVTIIGYGSGGISTTMHLVSPLSKGLFQRAIIMSGSATTQGQLPIHQKPLALKQAQVLGCPYDTTSKAINCLYTKSPEDFARSYFQLYNADSHTMTVFSPVIEQESPENPQPFLTEDPTLLIQQGKFHSVPIIIGVTKDEMGYLVIPAEEQAQKGNNQLYDEWNQNWDELAPKYLGYESGTTKSANISEELKQFYLHGELLKAGSYKQVANLFSDSSNGFPVHRLVKLLSQYSSNPVYYYQYVHEGCDTYKTWSNGTRFGVVHNDELFIGFKVGGRPSLCEKDLAMFARGMSFISNFLKTGRTAPTDATEQSGKWEPTTLSHPQYLQFGFDFQMQSGYINEERMNKWEQLFPLSSVVAAHKQNDWLVQSPAGTFRGSLMKTYTGKDIYSFRGIPYAQPPTYQNRFKAPIPVKPFNGVYDATKDGPSCPQPGISARIISEDCLNLNVYTTTLSENSSHHPNLPVIVFIHPGSMFSLSGSSYDFGPKYILEKETVLVTFNYRLGALGFLSTGDESAPGNAGLKDQVLVLEWVKQNIKQFGGDPDNITLFGYGSGAVSATLHLVSPLSKGLYKRMMIMSGSAITQTQLPTAQQELALKQAQVSGCPYDTITNAINCLYTKQHDIFSWTYFQLYNPNNSSITVFSPVIEQESPGNPRPFLTKDPVELIREGKINCDSVFIGVNKDELGSLAIRAEEEAQMGNTYIYDMFYSHWNDVAPGNFGYESGTTRSVDISRELKEFYFSNETFQLGSWKKFSQLYGDALVGFGVHRLVKMLSQYSTVPIYYYHYVYEGCDTYATWSNGTRFGVSHYDELLLAFNNPQRPPHCENDVPIAEAALSLMWNFAKTGNPTPADAQNYLVKWERFTKENPQYLQWGLDTKMISGYINADRMSKWDQIFSWPPVGA